MIQEKIRNGIEISKEMLFIIYNYYIYLKREIRKLKMGKDSLIKNNILYFKYCSRYLYWY